MPRARIGTLLAVALAALGAACASNDLGTPCHLLRADNTEAAPRPGHDVVQSGSGECEQFACVSFAGAPARCSRPCAKVGDACEGGTVCQPAVLDEELLAEARSRLEGHDEDHDGRDDFDQLAAGITDALYCGPGP
jgi:hypothetical protein